MTTLILGVGNLLLGDEGFGVHVVQKLQGNVLPPNVDILDGGTAGMYLMDVLQRYDKVIIIDAALDGYPVGTVRHFKPKFTSDYPPLLTVHEIGLNDVVESMRLMEDCPEIEMITVTAAKYEHLTMEMTPEVAAAESKVIALLEESVGAKL